MSATALFMHVPVDKVFMTRGPGAQRCLEIRDLTAGFSGSTEQYVEQEFVMRTGASSKSFRRNLKIATMTLTGSYNFVFTGVVNGYVVSGMYNTQRRTGWFTLD